MEQVTVGISFLHVFATSNLHWRGTLRVLVGP